MAEFELEMDRGDTRTIVITATYPTAIPEQSIAAGDPFPLNDKTVYFTAKKSLSLDDDTAALFKKVTAAGITVRPAPNQHIADVALETADTEGVTRTGDFYCDCRAKDGAGNLWTVATGKLKVVENVTRTTA